MKEKERRIAMIKICLERAEQDLLRAWEWINVAKRHYHFLIGQMQLPLEGGETNEDRPLQLPADPDSYLNRIGGD